MQRCLTELVLEVFERNSAIECIVDLLGRRGWTHHPLQVQGADQIVIAARGGVWADTVAQARAVDPRCQGDYRSADIPLIVTGDIVAKDGIVLAEAGGRIGYAPAITGWHGWADLIRRLVAVGVDPERDLIEVTARVQYNKNASGEWGTLVFESFQAV